MWLGELVADVSKRIGAPFPGVAFVARRLILLFFPLGTGITCSSGTSGNVGGASAVMSVLLRDDGGTLNPKEVRRLMGTPSWRSPTGFPKAEDNRLVDEGPSLPSGCLNSDTSLQLVPAPSPLLGDGGRGDISCRCVPETVSAMLVGTGSRHSSISGMPSNQDDVCMREFRSRRLS